MTSFSKQPVQKFSTAPIAPADQFEAFRLRIGAMFEMDGSTAPKSFDAAIESVHFGSMLVSRMRTQHFVYQRCRRRIASDFIDHFMIRIDLERRPEDGALVNQLLVIDLSQISEPNQTPRHNVSVVLPRRSFGASADRLAMLHQRPQSHPGALFLADHLLSLMSHGPGLEGQVTQSISNITPSLVTNCLLDHDFQIEEERKADLELALLVKARRVIVDQLCSPQLNPENLARQLGLSRSSLYRLFEPVGGVAKVIREARMRAAARAIVEGDEGLKIGDVAHRFCFSSDAQFSSSFKAHHGCTPSEFRAFASQTEAGSLNLTDSGDRLFPRWLANL